MGVKRPGYGRASCARACTAAAVAAASLVLVACGEPSFDGVVLWVDGISDDVGRRQVRIYEAGERDALPVRPDIPGSSVDLLQVGVDDRARGFAVSGTDATVWVERGSGRLVTLSAAAAELSTEHEVSAFVAEEFSFTGNGDGLLRQLEIDGAVASPWLFAPLSGPEALRVHTLLPPFESQGSLHHATDAPVLVWAQSAGSPVAVAGELRAFAYPSAEGQGPWVDEIRPLGRGTMVGRGVAIDTSRYLTGCPERLCVSPSGRQVLAMAPEPGCDLLRWSWVEAESTEAETPTQRISLACPGDEEAMLAAVLDDDLVVLDDSRRLYLVDLTAASVSSIPKPVGMLTAHPAARGQVLVITSSQGEVLRIDAQGPRMVSGIQTPCDEADAPVVSPSGTWVVQTCNGQSGALGGLDGQVRRVSVLGVDLFGGIPMQAIAVDDEGTALLYSVSSDDDDGIPRGLFVLSGDGKLTRVDELEPFPGRVMLPGATGLLGRFSAAGPA